MLKLIASMICRGFVADQPEKAGLQLVKVSPGALFESYDLWAAAGREPGFQAIEQRLCRFPRLAGAIRHPAGEVKHHRLDDHVPDNQVFKLLVRHSAGRAHGSSSALYTAYLAWSAGAA